MDGIRGNYQELHNERLRKGPKDLLKPMFVWLYLYYLDGSVKLFEYEFIQNIRLNLCYKDMFCYDCDDKCDRRCVHKKWRKGMLMSNSSDGAPVNNIDYPCKYQIVFSSNVDPATVAIWKKELHGCNINWQQASIPHFEGAQLQEMPGSNGCMNVIGEIRYKMDSFSVSAMRKGFGGLNIESHNGVLSQLDWMKLCRVLCFRSESDLLTRYLLGKAPYESIHAIEYNPM